MGLQRSRSALYLVRSALKNILCTVNAVMLFAVEIKCRVVFYWPRIPCLFFSTNCM